MPRTFEHHFKGGVGVGRPATAGAVQGALPTSGEDADLFEAAADSSIIGESILPEAFLGTGTLKLDVYGGANTTTAADDVRWDAQTEFRTPGASESINADNFDATPDSATMTFSTTAYSLQKQTITLTPAVTPVKGDRYRFKLTRDANNAGGLDDLAVTFYGTDYVLYEEV